MSAILGRPAFGPHKAIADVTSRVPLLRAADNQSVTCRRVSCADRCGNHDPGQDGRPSNRWAMGSANGESSPAFPCRKWRRTCSSSRSAGRSARGTERRSFCSFHLRLFERGDAVDRNPRERRNLLGQAHRRGRGRRSRFGKSAKALRSPVRPAFPASTDRRHGPQRDLSCCANLGGDASRSCPIVTQSETHRK